MKAPQAQLAFTRPVHPGQFVREQYLEPRGLSVVAAAKLVGVGRPAFSNFLNGNAAATPEMAARIEVAFGMSQESLLAMQSSFDAAEARSRGAPVDAMPYAAPFLGIKARDIEAWADRNISTRSRLAVFLRTLVNSTGRALQMVDFPGNDDAERPGWDGKVECKQGIPWIPEGASGWEFGTNQDPKSKADGDFAKSVKATPHSERVVTTFVFVTPRHWPGKSAWIADKQKVCKWRAVRAYDSSDIEQWLEQSISAQAWFAQETGIPHRGVRTLDQCWADWSNVSEDPLPTDLFAPAIEQAKKALVSRLSSPLERPIVITADSSEEALAFLARFFDTVSDASVAAFRDRVLVFDEPGVVRELSKGTDGFVAIAHTPEVERELAPLMKSVRSIVVLPRNAANVEPDASLEPLSETQFRSALESNGYSRDEIGRLASESGRSLTVLRRRLAMSPSIQTPAWAANVKIAGSLVPFLWAGAWNSTKTADQEVVNLMANVNDYDVLERDFQQLAALNDPPVWSVGEYRGISSKIDLLFAIANAITRADLERFFDVAHIVLGEDDPSLDLPEDQRWAAAIYGKSREFSGGLRRSIAETLVLLSVHGAHLFLARLGFDCEVRAQRLVRELLTPLTTRRLEANDGNLTAYAEAAPGEFLSIVEDDLKSATPETYGLLRPTGSGLFGSCVRTGLLWALEGLAWSPSTMHRVALILAQLSQIEITDNWINRPINSLQAIFRAWMPQTAAPLDVRIKVLRQLGRRYPMVAWKICVRELRPGHDTGDYSHKPAWRNDGYGFGEPVSTWGPIMSFKRDVAEMVINWPSEYRQEMLCDLVNCLLGFSPAHQTMVWRIIGTWSERASDEDKASLREHIRRSLLSRARKPKAQEETFAALSREAKIVCAKLEPSDIREKHAWLFREQWVQESADEIEDSDHDFQKRDERITSLRAAALSELLSACGIADVVAFTDRGNAAGTAGFILARQLLNPSQVGVAIVEALKPSPASMTASRRMLMSGLIEGVSDPMTRHDLLKSLRSQLDDDAFVRVLLSAPFRRETWELVDALDEGPRNLYWKEASPNWIRDPKEEMVEAIERLLDARRPRAAFSAAHMELSSLDPELLLRLMTAVGQESDEPAEHYRLDEYYVEQAFKRIDQSTEIALERKASLEYMYLSVLAKPRMRHGSYGIPNLETYIAQHPEFYVHAIVHTFKRSDNGTDPIEYSVSKEQGARLAEQGYRFLDALETIPGRDDSGEIQAAGLAAWVNTVRGACENLGRLNIADVKIGELLAHAPADSEGVWPCEAVRDVLEELHSSDMVHGARIGRFNLRGVHWRGPSGDQEREIAAGYREWAEAVQYSHPFVSSELLMEMAYGYERDARREDTRAHAQRRLT